MAWMNRTRCVKAVRLYPDELLNLMGNWRYPTVVALPVMTEGSDESGNPFEIPADYEVLSVVADPFDKMVKFLIAHPSFPEVPVGEYVPILQLTRVCVHGLKCVPGQEDADRPIEVRGA